MPIRFDELPEAIIDAVFSAVVAEPDEEDNLTTPQSRALPLLVLSRYLYAFAQEAMHRRVRICYHEEKRRWDRVLDMRPEVAALVDTLEVEIPGMTGMKSTFDTRHCAVLVHPLFAALAPTLRSLDLLLMPDRADTLGETMRILTQPVSFHKLEQAKFVMGVFDTDTGGPYTGWNADLNTDSDDDEDAQDPPPVLSAIASVIRLFGPGLQSLELGVEGPYVHAEDVAAVMEDVELPCSLRELRVLALPRELVGRLITASSASLAVLSIAEADTWWIGGRDPDPFARAFASPLATLHTLRLDSTASSDLDLHQIPALNHIIFVSGLSAVAQLRNPALPARSLAFQIESYAFRDIRVITKIVAMPRSLPNVKFISLKLHRNRPGGSNPEEYERQRRGLVAQIARADLDLQALVAAASGRSIRVEWAYTGRAP